MATDFTAINAAVQAQIDGAITPLTTQITALKSQLATAQATVTTQTGTITDLKAQLALAQQAAEDDGMIYFKSDKSAQIYVYNPLTGTKRGLSVGEYNLIKAVDPSVVITTVPDAQVITIKSVA